MGYNEPAPSLATGPKGLEYQMNIDQAAIFFTGSILTMMGFIVIVAGIIVINNLLHRYWKPVKFAEYVGPRFVEEDQSKEKS
jgi:hypothetical protein